MTVYVCPTRDIECGDMPERWCFTCPQHGPRMVEADCRTCRNFYIPHETCIEDASCTNGDHYEPLPPVRLWRTAP